MTKRIVLCADDYGQALHISQGILELIKNGRISATSCMVNQLDWRLHAEWLLPYQGHIDIGLHFNLTEGRPLSDLYRASYGDQFLSLPRVMSRAFLRQWRQDLLFAECEAQLMQFRAIFGCFPDFIDGHQHIHQFPMVRDALLQVYQVYLNTNTCYVRVPAAKMNYFHFTKQIKKWVIAQTGANALAKALTKAGIPYPKTFAGIYDFSKALNYPNFFKQFLCIIETSFCKEGPAHL